MEEMMYFMLVVASATFVVKTIVGWIQTARFENEKKVRETERRIRIETYDKARLEQLEKFQEKLDKYIEDNR